MIAGLEQTSEVWLLQLGRASIWGGVGIVLAWVICRGIGRIPPGVKCWVWRVALVKLVVGVIWVAQIAIPVFKPEEVLSSEVAVNQGVEPVVEVVRPIMKPVDLSASRRVERRPWALLLAVGWAIGCFSVVSMYGWAWIGARKIRRQCGSVNSAVVTRAYEAAGRALGMGKLPGLFECGCIGGPAVVGMVRPVVLVPVGIEQFEGRGLEAMLGHELAHVARGDMRWGLLTIVARAVFWFHPLAWVAEHELGICQESACDESAMRAGRTRASDYGRILLDMVALRGSMRGAGLGVISNYSNLHRRISAMNQMNSWSARRRMVAGMVIGAVAICGIVPWTLTAQEAKKDATPLREETPASRPSEVALVEPKRNVEQQWFLGEIVTQSMVIRASRDGMVQEIDCMTGDRVRKGDRLAQFDSVAAQSDLMQARAALDKDKAILKRVAAGGRADGASDVDTLKADITLDEAKLVLKEHELSGMMVSAPMAGVIGAVKVQSGEFVSKGMELLTIVSMEKPRASVWLPAAMFLTTKVGQAVEVYIAGEPHIYKGKIRFVSPQVDSQSQMCKAEADIDDPGSNLRPGLGCRITIPLK